MTTSSYYIDGIDLCSIQGMPDFQRVADAGFKFAYIKCSQYSSIQDHMFDRLVEGFLKVKMAVGAYHFCSQASRTGEADHEWIMTDPQKQMEFFYKASSGLGKLPGELPPMIDWEYCTLPPPVDCVIWLQRAAESVDRLWYPKNDSIQAAADGWIERHGVIYTYPYYSGQHQPYLGHAKGLGKHPLCFASYKSVGPKLVPWYPKDGEVPLHPVPKPWDRALLVQYSGNNGLKVPGIGPDCDRQVFTGSQGEWQDFLGNKRPVSSMEGGVKE